ncbi:hypothetical protein M3Y99_00176500 [Aphelenchoides fujianensis]|nr:hypothetical protein M3Y99_00176500 [Aphelenchoides fujianensis]
MDTTDPIVKRIPREYRAFFVIGSGILPASDVRPRLLVRQHPPLPHELSAMETGIPFAMVAGGLLEERFGARVGCAIGTSMYIGGLLLSYWTIQASYGLLLLTMGLIASFGQGIAYVNVLTQCQRWLPSRVGLVSGIITAGFGSSAFIAAPIETRFVNPDNLPPSPTDHFFHQPELLARVPQMFLLLGCLFAVVDLIGLTKTEGASLLLDDDNEEEAEVEAEEEESTDDGRHLVVRVIPRKQLLTSPTLADALRDAPLQRHLGANHFRPLQGARTLSQFIADDHFLATVNSFAAAANCVSRVLWGMYADRTSYQLTMSIACSLGALSMWLLPFIKWVASPSLFFCWISLMFTCIGATYTLIPFAIHRAFGSANFGIAYGFVQICLAISGFITALASQFLLPLVGFDTFFLIAGTAMAVSLVLTLLIRRSSHYGAKL